MNGKDDNGDGDHGRVAFDLKQDPDHVYTRSPLRMWWLRIFRGHKIEAITREPKSVSFGKIVYATTWHLKPRK